MPSKNRMLGTLENVAVSIGLIARGVQITFLSCNARTGGSAVLACVVSGAATLVTVAINGAINGGPDKKATAAQAIVVALNRMAEDIPIALSCNVFTVRSHRPKITFLYSVACATSFLICAYEIFQKGAFLSVATIFKHKPVPYSHKTVHNLIRINVLF